VGGAQGIDRHVSEPRKLALVMNPSAAGGRSVRLVPEVHEALSELGLAHHMVETRDMEHALAAAREAAEAGEVVVALGGDGLVGALAGAVRDRAPLGILPAGRGNDFARELSIPSEARAACRVLAEGTERRLDLGEANGRPFVCIASTGYDSVANRIANEARIVRGNLVYAYAAVRALASWRPVSFTVKLDGSEHEFEGYTVAVANTRFYGGGMCVAPNADPTDGRFEVICVEDVSKLRFLANLPKVFSAEHVQLEGVRTFRAQEVEVAANRPFDVYADGEPITQLPASVRLTPGLLRVLVPDQRAE
jgi:YegS/Rv2252/BmrU family lipid kinase